MKTLTIALVILLLLSIGAVIYLVRIVRSSESNRLAENARVQVAIAAKESTIKSARDSVHLIQSERKILDSVARVSQNVLKREITVHKNTIATLRPLVQPHIDSIPDLRSFVQAQDSTILKQDSTIVSLESSNGFLKYSFEKELKQKDVEIKATIETSDLWRQSAESSESALQKMKKRRFSVGISGGYSVVSTGGEVKTGPAIQVGIVYNLFKF